MLWVLVSQNFFHLRLERWILGNRREERAGLCGDSCLLGARYDETLSYEQKLTHLAALPALLAHCALLPYTAMVMSICGGLLIYGTIISFKMVFREEEDF